MARRAFGFVVALVLGLGVLLAAPAAAHTDLESTEPADGSVVATGPPSAVLTFSEDLAPAFVETHLERADRRVVALAESAVRVDGRTLTVVLPALDVDVYQLWYKVRDPIDLHVTAGSVVFGVGTSPTITSTFGAGTAATPLDVALAALERLGLVVAVGALVVALVLAPATVRARGCTTDGFAADVGALVPPALRIGERAAAAVVVAEAALLVVETLRIGGGPLLTLWRLLTLSGFGKRALAAVAVALALRHTLGLLRRVQGPVAVPRPDLGGLVAIPVGLAVALTAVVSLSGHAGVGGTAATGVVLRVAHLGGIALWIGPLVVVVALRRPVTAWGLLRSFSLLAPASVALVVASGFALSGREVQSLYAARHTTFGQAWGAKLLVVVAVLGLGGLQHVRLRRGRTAGGRRLMVEAGLAVVAVLAGAVLATTPPAVGARFEPQAAETPAVRTASTDDLLVTVSIRPNRPGRNVVSVDVLSTRRPAPGTVESVAVTITDATGAVTVLEGAGDPTRPRIDLGTVDLGAPGPLAVRAAVTRPRRPVLPVDLSWAVNGPRIGRPAAEGLDRPLLVPLALAAAAVSVLGIVGLIRRRRPGSALHPGADGLLPIGEPSTTLSGHEVTVARRGG